MEMHTAFGRGSRLYGYLREELYGAGQGGGADDEHSMLCLLDQRPHELSPLSAVALQCVTLVADDEPKAAGHQ